MIEDIKNLIQKENKQMTEKEDWYELEFEYLGYTAKAVRYSEYSHLCGYIKKDFELSDEMYEALNDNSHGGITYDNEDCIGFDCNHARDFNLARYYQFKEIGLGVDFETHLQHETYRDLNYVIQTLKNMISAIADEHIIRNEDE
ncbi:hypothetical protein JZH61_07650 [Staphylococcus saprophyticus]|uniref:hypothetical protein n=1 Tax=Staphylococcus saprophyticus TaxID=29385 RepID=UPI0019CFAFE9|nr:hypothetical protein [Staphylococcus saprophyticus]MBN6203702.1 hypothetical protein [Staphylococcus saprophyticus]